MKNKIFFLNRPSSLPALILGVITVLLSIPFLLQVTIGTDIDGLGFNWKLDDFIIYGGLLTGAGLFSYLILIKVRSKKQRLRLCGVLLLFFLLIWIDLAVGILNIPGFSGN